MAKTASANPFEALVGYHLRRASLLVMSDLAERLSALDLRITDASILVLLESAPLISQSEIGRRLAIKRANMAPLIAGLVMRGLVEKGAAAGRLQPLRLTEAGERCAAAARQRMADHDHAFFGALPPEVRRSLTANLALLWHRAPNDEAARKVA